MIESVAIASLKAERLSRVSAALTSQVSGIENIVNMGISC